MRVRLLKKLSIALYILAVCFDVEAQTVGISDATFTPNTQAVLDLSSDRRGFLPPRLELNGNDLPISGAKPTGLMVHNVGGAIGPDGLYYWTGSAWTQIATVQGSLSGSGTVNYLTKWTPSGTALGNSQLFDNGTNIGIGTGTPVESLELYKSGSNPVVLFHSSGVSSYKLGSDGNIFKLAAMDNGFGGHTGDFAANDSQVLSIINNGNVGVGNVAPGHKLSVGNATSDGQSVTIRGYSNIGNWKGGGAFGYTSGAVILGELSGVAQIGGHNSSLGAWSDLYINSGGGNVGFGNAAPTAKVHIGPRNDNHLYMASANNLYGWRLDTRDNGGGSVPFRIFRRVNGSDSEALTILNQNGNVGINTTTPGAKLHLHTTGTGGLGISDDGWASIRMDGQDNKSLWIHYGAAGTNDLRFARTGDGFGGWEANIVRFDMDAPGESMVLDGTGNLTLGTLSGAGDRMVVANAGGTLTTQSMPGGVLPAGTAAQTLYHNGTSWVNTSNLANDGSTITLGNFDNNDSDQWPLVQWRRDIGNNWDEGLIKGSSSRGAWGRTGFGIHMHSSRHFAFFSSGWDPLLDIEGGTGRLFIKGNTGIGNSNPTSHLQVGAASSDVQPVTIRGYSNTGNWKGGGAFGYTSATVIMGELNGVAQIGGHNSGLGAWANLALNSSGGNVAIGGTSPIAKLEVDHNGASAYGVGILLNQNAIGNSDGPKMQFRKTMTSTKDWSLGILNGVNVGTFTLNEDAGVGGFGTSRLAVLPGGNVGVGSTNPGYKLDVAGTLRSQGWVMIGTGADRLSLELQGSFHRMAFEQLRFYDWNSGGDMVTFNDGNVGIGTTNPSGKLHVAGNHGNGIFTDGNDRAGVGATGVYPQMVMMSGNSGNGNHGATFMLGGYDAGASGAHKHWSIGTAGANSTFLDIGYHAGTDLNPHAGIRNYNGSTKMTILNSGFVGLNSLNPINTLHVERASTDNRVVAQFVSPGNNSWGQTLMVRTTGAGNDGAKILFRSRDAKNWSVGGIEGTDNGFVITEDGGDGIYGSGFGTTRLYVQAGGNVGIGNTGPAQKLDVTGTIRGTEIRAANGIFRSETRGNFFLALQADRNMVLYDGAAIWATGTTVSDIRTKKDIKPLEETLPTLMELSAIRFKYKEEENLDDDEHIGVIAQEILKYYPDMVFHDEKSDRYIVHYDKLTTVLLKGIQEQQAQIEELKSTNQLLQSDNQELKEAVSSLKMLENEVQKIKTSLYQEANGSK